MVTAPLARGRPAVLLPDLTLLALISKLFRSANGPSQDDRAPRDHRP